MNLEFLNRTEKKELMEELNEKFGIHEINLLLMKQGKEKVRGFSGSLAKEDLIKIAREIRVEKIGLYLIKREEVKEGRKAGIRLSFDSTTSVFSMQINKNVVEINEEQKNLWLRGKSIETGDKDIKEKTDAEDFPAIKYKDYFLGCGKLSQGRIANFVPKERRIRN